MTARARAADTGTGPAEAPAPGGANPAAVLARWSVALPGTAGFSRDVYWLAIPAVDDRYQRRACAGRSEARWFAYLVRRHLDDQVGGGRMLSLGCGAGALERKLVALGAGGRIDAVDLSPVAIRAARDEAARAGLGNVNYSVRDLQHDGVPVGPYDAAWFNGSLHHIERLEPVLDGVLAALVPGGWLFVNEYVGADRFAFPARQRALMSAAFALLPERLRRSCNDADRGRVLETCPIPDPVEVEAVDPSEAVRSSAILGAIAERFEVIERNDCGGSLLQFLLAGIAGNFREDDPESMHYLDMLFAIEDTLIDSGDLASDFVVLAARARSGRPTLPDEPR